MTAKRFAIITLGSIAAIVVVVVGLVAVVLTTGGPDPFVSAYERNCSVCHGSDLEGGALGPPLAGVDLTHGDSIVELSRSIAEGFPQSGMPPWSQTVNETQIKGLAIYVAERRAGREFTDFKVDKPLAISHGTRASEEHDFRIETVVTGLDPLPYSIEPLADGSILVTEKKRGLTIVSSDGVQSKLIGGTPKTFDYYLPILELEYGMGWLMDVAVHPEYQDNGWIYLHHGHICEECGEAGDDPLIPRTMNRLVRGRIKEGQWVDEEIIWKSDPQYYSRTPDLAAGGRIAFDREGFVFFSVGMKGDSNYAGIQDLSSPYGKTYRVHDDGRVPSDNPFVDHLSALKSIWTFGHRSPQGLEFNPDRQQLWGTEMGPRGGDEVNLLLPGRNYGWPLYSKGLDYDGTRVEYGIELGIEFDLDDIEQPVVDFTPAPAISSFVFYDGDRFPQWRGNIIVGSLKATELYRVVLEGDRAVHRETLIGDLARIRDVEVGPDGAIYLLLEHGAGGQIVRLLPDG